MLKKENRKTARLKRHLRVRRKVQGTPEQPRLCVFRSLKNIYAQVIDDNSGHTLVSASSLDTSSKEEGKAGSNKEAAKAVGELLAQRCREKGIETVVFDRGGFLFHGRVKALAEGARESGLKF